MNTLNTIMNLGFVSLLLVFAPMVIICPLFFYKKNISNNTKIYLYAFSAGLLAILSTLGLMRNGIESLDHHLIEYFPNNKYLDLTKIGLIASSAAIGLFLSVLIKVLVFKISAKKNLKKASASFNHSCCVINIEDLVKTSNGKILSIIVLSSHKIIDGIALGVLVSQNQDAINLDNFGIILLFIIHDIPVMIVLFFEQKNKIKNIKIFFYMVLNVLISVPFIFLGGYAGEYFISSNNTFWIIPFLEILTGSSLLFTTLMEIIPEFIHNKHLCSKHWYLTVLWLSIGIILASILTLFHQH